jgi:site-specific recombinase XerC
MDPPQLRQSARRFRRRDASKVRGGDLLKLRIGDIVSDGQIRHRATVVQQKTGRPVPFELGVTTRESVQTWLTLRDSSIEECIFTRWLDGSADTSTRQYGRLVQEWVAAIGLNGEDYGAHAPRWTKPSILCKQTGDPRLVQVTLGHTRIASTVRYPGVYVEDAHALSKAVDI